MKIGIIRCQQTEDYCPGTTDFRIVREKKGVFEGIKEDIEIIGFINCGGCPAKKQSSEQENWLSVGQILLYLQAASRRERQ